ncbi:membrane-bound ClpP family serine protease [Parabacteroides sp. PF5-5]|uniref:NfeD family protein n=1 Tax=unclassified Parabacteroides TaxID=2649774 RepID=UPI0024770DF7|nr:MULTISPECIES: NfeD family protein [unclassified Parabacteroides]MDH6305858.1 membrane-bound ClpP family serine protease [Parabacteroides sp. PH5-39]MDH6317328.1 membrane-bound ClpP family serine protease [Parabacteroides sp. PF5-13]MDH6320536.1 membrane-bound ClpP family serine protease [Parabacteroides sp. PH5-13]MDH6324301.1 membrane-bound ClpP family serine protease [Parabacteroides sp. PH5-8]MDH6328498.1 membrane-bound ClpP family serine protease [Parabacteroides sp. PH5-41]
MILDIVIIIFLMALAIFLILLEIFLLPGITIAGIGGALFAIGGVIYAYTISPFAGHITLLGSVIGFVITFFWLLRAKSFNKVALNTDVDSKLTSSRELGIEVGDEGISLSRLAPIGKARIKDITVEAKSTGEFIDEETPIVVVRVDGYNVLVTTKDNTIHS